MCTDFGKKEFYNCNAVVNWFATSTVDIGSDYKIILMNDYMIFNSSSEFNASCLDV